jgi:hypothetical protein
MDNGIEDFANAFVDGDYDKVVSITEEHFCADDVANVKEMTEALAEFSPEEIAEFGIDEEFAIPENWSYEIKDTTEDGDSATVEVEMTDDDGTTTQSFGLVKVDDEWKICGEF